MHHHACSHCFAAKPVLQALAWSQHVALAASLTRRQLFLGKLSMQCLKLGGQHAMPALDPTHGRAAVATAVHSQWNLLTVL